MDRAHGFRENLALGDEFLLAVFLLNRNLTALTYPAFGMGWVCHGNAVCGGIVILRTVISGRPVG
jgi:hypothetical protein